MQKSFLNNVGRLECDGVEFHCGDVVEVFIDNEWRITRLEHSLSQGGFYSIHGYNILNKYIRPAS